VAVSPSQVTPPFVVVVVANAAVGSGGNDTVISEGSTSHTADTSNAPMIVAWILSVIFPSLLTLLSNHENHSFFVGIYPNWDINIRDYTKSSY